ncbi:MAG: hypothetical protein COB15_14645 [Flavobacteriales bacterium]|nr:MAG: hypothetical protein COB15_14645 [Flavobacteriales bacterium]
MLNLITVYPKPIADFSFSPDDANVYNPEITFSDQSIVGYLYEWNLGDGTILNDVNPIHEYSDSGTYIVTLSIENIYGCKDRISKTVIIDPAYALWIPNVFTPDGDGLNDYFFATGFGIVELQTMIVDRWRELLFEGNSMSSKWDGNYKGELVMSAVYVYKIKAKDVFGAWHDYIGKVTLIK